jgi:uncharacterized protein YndB with AHSA1/START domain
MPTARRSRTIAASVEELWELVSDPHHLPRWWPRVTRVEDVDGGAFTEVMMTKKGKVVRADFHLIEADERQRSLTWEQLVAGTPFARVLKSAETELRLVPVASIPDLLSGAEGGQDRLGEPATEVTIELRQALNGLFPRLGGHMVRRAALSTIDQALDGLQRIGG